MRIWKLLGSFLVGGAVMSCGQPQDPAPQKAAPPIVKWEEIKGDAVAFVRMHPGAAQKNTYVNWKHYANPETGDKIWRVNGKDISAEAANALENLAAAVTQDLIPSDGIYTCRYRENMPQYRLDLTRDGKHYSVISSSDCQHGSPFNVLVDGIWHIQMNGEIGKALETALQSINVTLKVGETPAVFMLSDKIQIQGFEGKAQTHPAAYYDAKFRADATFGGALKYFETLFGALELPEVACNQAKSTTCSDVSARYTVKVLPGVTYLQPIKFHAAAVEAKFPTQTEFEQLAKARENAGFKAYAAAYGKDTPVQVTWHDGGDCKMVKGLAKHFELPETLSCSYWQLSAKDKPSGIYYNGLKSFWIEPSDGTQAFMDAICHEKSLSKTSQSKLCQKKAPQKPIAAGSNVFIRHDGNVMKFVTQNGVTKIES